MPIPSDISERKTIVHTIMLLQCKLWKSIKAGFTPKKPATGDVIYINSMHFNAKSSHQKNRDIAFKIIDQ
jgi:hypothetical protein